MKEEIRRAKPKQQGLVDCRLRQTPRRMWRCGLDETRQTGPIEKMPVLPERGGKSLDAMRRYSQTFR